MLGILLISSSQHLLGWLGLLEGDHQPALPRSYGWLEICFPAQSMYFDLKSSRSSNPCFMLLKKVPSSTSVAFVKISPAEIRKRTRYSACSLLVPESTQESRAGVQNLASINPTTCRSSWPRLLSKRYNGHLIVVRVLKTFHAVELKVVLNLLGGVMLRATRRWYRSRAYTRMWSRTVWNESM